MASSATISIHRTDDISVSAGWLTTSRGRFYLSLDDDAGACTVNAYGTLGELQQFGAKVTAAIRDAVEAQRAVTA